MDMSALGSQNGEIGRGGNGLPIGGGAASYVLIDGNVMIGAGAGYVNGLLTNSSSTVGGNTGDGRITIAW
jgi:hypothetical protein